MQLFTKDPCYIEPMLSWVMATQSPDGAMHLISEPSPVCGYLRLSYSTANIPLWPPLEVAPKGPSALPPGGCLMRNKRYMLPHAVAGSDTEQQAQWPPERWGYSAHKRQFMSPL